MEGIAVPHHSAEKKKKKLKPMRFSDLQTPKLNIETESPSLEESCNFNANEKQN